MRDFDEDSVVYRRLALRVILQAWKDLASPGGRASDRATAREFLVGSPMLVHWCRVATLDPRVVISWAQALLAQPNIGRPLALELELDPESDHASRHRQSAVAKIL